jgi:hypothetical protein
MLWLVYERCADCTDPQCFFCRFGKHLTLRLVNSEREPLAALGGPFRTSSEFSRYASAGQAHLFCVADDGKIYFDFDYHRPLEANVIANLTQLQAALDLIETQVTHGLDFARQLPAEDEEVAQSLEAIAAEIAKVQTVMAQLLPDNERKG